MPNAKKTTRAQQPAATPESLPDTTDFLPRELSKQEFGRRLTALMTDRGWSQSDLARQAKLGRDAISTYVRGLTFPTPGNLAKLAKALGVKSETILPNQVITAVKNDALPMLEIRQAQGQEDRVWLRVNRLVSPELAGQIFVLLNKEK